MIKMGDDMDIDRRTATRNMRQKCIEEIIKNQTKPLIPVIRKLKREVADLIENEEV